MAEKTYSVLFLCTGNSARSILAEAILERSGNGRFRAFSAGSQPKGDVHPLALDLLRHKGFDTGLLRSKSWDEFATDGAPAMDMIITVCNNAAGEVCPIWPGHPLVAHWGIPDPAAADGADAERRHAFQEAFRRLSTRIDRFLALRWEILGKPGRQSLQQHLNEIGRSTEESD